MRVPTTEYRIALIDELTIEVDDNADITTVTVTGEVDFGNADRLRTVFLDLTGGTANVGIDLSGVAFMDSTALGVVIAAKKELEENGRRLIITALSPRARRIVEIAGLVEFLGV